MFPFKFKTTHEDSCQCVQLPGCLVSVCPPPFTSLLSVVYERESDPVQFCLFPLSAALSTREGGRTANVPDRGSYSSLFHVEVEHDLNISFLSAIFGILVPNLE